MSHIEDAPGLNSKQATATASASISDQEPAPGCVEQAKPVVKVLESVTEIDPPPDFFAHRNTIFDRYLAEYQKRIAQLPRQEINITISEGKVIVGTSWETTPFEIVEGIAGSLAERAIVAKVSGTVDIREFWLLVGTSRSNNSA